MAAGCASAARSWAGSGCSSAARIRTRSHGSRSWRRASRFISRATRRSGRPARRRGPAITIWRRPSASGPVRMPSRPRSSTWWPRRASTTRYGAPSKGALGREPLRILEQSPGGISVVLDPTGTPLGDALCRDEGILYAEIDLARSVEPKQFHDVVGSYNRFDIFALTVDRSARRPATFVDERQDSAG